MLSKEDKDRLNRNYIRLVNIGKSIFSGFIIDDENKEAFKLLTVWASEENESIDSKKGILLFGGKGTGKTIAIRILQSAVRGLDNRFIIYSTQDIVGFISGNNKKALDYCENFEFNKNQCFDDLGFERSEINTFGNKINPMAEIIAKRYELFVKKGIKTHFTTNLTDAEIESIYGDRVLDRLYEMCNFIKLTGNSRRK